MDPAAGFPFNPSGRPEPPATLVVPGDGSADAAARRIADAVHAQCGVRPPVSHDGAFDTAHAIALGRLDNNPLIERLYFRFQTLVDQWYPGRGGHVVHMLDSPIEPGRHVLVLGGSDSAGVEAAADCWLEALGAGHRGQWLLRVQLGPSHLPMPADRLDVLGTSSALVETPESRLPDGPYRPGYAGGSARDHLLRLGMYGPHADNSHLCRSSQLGLRYLYTGNETDGRAFREALLEDVSRGVIHRLYHYCSLRLFPLWAVLGGSPVFSNDERRAVAEAMRAYLLEESGVASLERIRGASQAPELFDRHLACDALNLWVGSDLLWRREADPKWLDCRQAADAYFESYADVDVPLTGLTEGYASYLEVVLEWLMHRHPDRIAGDERVRRWAERVVGLCTNQGLLLLGPQTDARRYPYHLLLRLAYLLGDGRYRWAADLRERQVESGMDRVMQFSAGQAYAGGVAACEPADHVGLRVFGANRRHLQLAAPDLAADEAFDRAVARSGWAPDDDYLAVCGTRGRAKPMPVVGTVAAYERLGCRLLATPGDHLLATETNPWSFPGVSVTIDGAGCEPPAGARLVGRWDTEAGSVLRLTVSVRDCYDWTRTLVWRPGAFLLIVDRVDVLSGEAFTVGATWRPTTPMQVSGRLASGRLTRPDGREIGCHIETLGGGQMVYDDAPLHPLHDDLAEADRFPRVHNVINGKRRRQPCVEMATLVHAAEDDGPVYRLGQELDDWVVVGPDHEVRVGLPDDAAPSLAVVDRLPDNGWGGESISGDSFVSVGAIAPKHSNVMSASSIETEPSAWAVDPDRELLAVGTKRGQVLVVDAKGQRVWEKWEPAGVTAVAFLDQHVIAGLRSGDVVRFDEQGRVLWDHTCGFRPENEFWPWWRLTTPRIACLATMADPDTGRELVAVGTGASAFNVLEAETGREVADRLNPHGLADRIRVHAMPPDGREHWLTANSTFTPYSAIGVWTATAAERAPRFYDRAMPPGSGKRRGWDMSGVADFHAGVLRRGEPERLAVLRHGAFNQLTLYDLAAGEPLWEADLGGRPIALAASGVADQTHLYTLDRYGWLVRFDPDGRRVGNWRVGRLMSGMAADEAGRVLVWDESTCTRVGADGPGAPMRLEGRPMGWLRLGSAEGLLCFNGHQVLLEGIPNG